MVRRRQPLTARQVRMRQEALSRAMLAGGTCECSSEAHISHSDNSFYCSRKLGNTYDFSSPIVQYLANGSRKPYMVFGGILMMCITSS